MPRPGPGRPRKRPDRVLADKAYLSRANRSSASVEDPDSIGQARVPLHLLEHPPARRSPRPLSSSTGWPIVVGAGGLYGLMRRLAVADRPGRSENAAPTGGRCRAMRGRSAARARDARPGPHTVVFHAVIAQHSPIRSASRSVRGCDAWTRDCRSTVAGPVAADDVAGVDDTPGFAPSRCSSSATRICTCGLIVINTPSPSTSCQPARRRDGLAVADDIRSHRLRASRPGAETVGRASRRYDRRKVNGRKRFIVTAPSACCWS